MSRTQTAAEIEAVESPLPALVPEAAANDNRAFALFLVAAERAKLAGGYWDRVFALREARDRAAGTVRTRENETTRIARR